MLLLFLSFVLVMPSLSVGKKRRNHTYRSHNTYHSQKKRCALVTQGITESVAVVTAKRSISRRQLDHWLTTACRWGSKRSVHALLQRGSDPNTTTFSPLSPLELAAYRRSPGIVALLLRYHADPLKVSHDGTSPLERISSRYHFSGMAYDIECSISEKEGGNITMLQKTQPDDYMTGEPFDLHENLIILNGKLWTKSSLMKHVLYTMGTKHGPRDPFTNIPIPKEILVRLAAHTGIPFKEIDHTQQNSGRLSLVAIARRLVPLESSLSIVDCAMLQGHVDHLKGLFAKRLERFNTTLAVSVHTR